jgi:Cu-Zn family superoxide dismutase
MKQSVLIAIALGGGLAFVAIGFLVGYSVRGAIIYQNVIEADVSRAICDFGNNPGSDVNGTVYIDEQDGTSGVIIALNLTGATDGAHGFHVHKTGNLRSNCIAASGHFNPFDKSHGGPTATERHVGDLGNIEFRGGAANYNFTDLQVTLRGKTSVIGRSFVIHAKQDDMGLTDQPDSKTSGAAGPRIACCTIAIDATKTV